MSSAETIVAEARHESPLWEEALRDPPAWQAIFGELVPRRYELGFETVYEAYLVHYGKPRLFDPQGDDERVLLGDYLYAHGLVRISDAGGVAAVAVMADLISRCAALRAAGAAGDGDAWVDAARALGGEPDAAATARALEQHAVRLAP